MRARLLMHLLAGGAAALSASLAPAVVSAAEPEIITGTLTRLGEPAAGVTVRALAPSGADSWYEVGRVTTNEGGQYMLTEDDIAEWRGPTVLRFEDPQQRSFPEYYNDAAYFSNALRINFGDGIPNPNINAALTPAAYISGRVTDQQGNPMAGLDVEAEEQDSAYNTDGLDSGYARTDANGRYSVGLLGGGEYTVKFEERTYTYAAEYYPDEPSYQTAAKVLTLPSQGASLPDVTMEKAGYLSGKLTDAAGAGIVEVDVLAYRRDTTRNEWIRVSLTYTDFPVSDGTYAFQALRPGTYRICFTDGAYGERQPMVKDECWDNVATLDQAPSLNVTAGQTTQNINAVLAFESPTTPPHTPPATTPPPDPITPPIVFPPPAPAPAPMPAILVSEFLSGAKTSGKLVVGKSVKVSAPAKVGVTSKIQWYAGRKAIKKATKTGLKLTSDLKGKVISVKVTATSAAVTKTRTIKLGKVR